MVYIPSRKAAAALGLHPQTLRRYASQGKIPYYRNSAGQRLYDIDTYLHGIAEPATICYCRVSSAKQRGDLNRQVAQMQDLYPAPKSSPTLREASTGNAEDCSPYWSDCIGEISSSLWLPIGTGWPGSALNSLSGWSSRTGAQSWFSTNRMPAPNPSSPRIYSPSSIRSVAGCTGSDVTGAQSRRIRVYPNQQ